jgi:class 3 adenylate cyclase
VLAILFTDIVGYTSFTYEAGEVISAKFRHIHDEIIIDQIKKDGYGEIIKQIGDSFLIVFSDPTVAVKQALKLQELFRLNAENLAYKDYQLKIRIGIHMGQVSVEDHIMPDVFGTHVNMASRVMSLARPGQVLVTGSVWENASGWLKDEQNVKVLSIYYGIIKLKGIGKATEIYEFYKSETGKIGAPKLLIKFKRKKLLVRVTIMSFLIMTIGFVIFYAFNKKSGQKEETLQNERGLLIIADIDSYEEDIEFSYGFLGSKNDTIVNNKPLIESIQPDQLKKVNETYIELLKSNFIVDFDIMTEDDLKREYAQKGATVPRNLRYDTLISRNNFNPIKYHFIVVIIPHLYKIRGM